MNEHDVPSDYSNEQSPFLSHWRKRSRPRAVPVLEKTPEQELHDWVRQWAIDNLDSATGELQEFLELFRIRQYAEAYNILKRKYDDEKFIRYGVFRRIRRWKRKIDQGFVPY